MVTCVMAPRWRPRATNVPPTVTGAGVVSRIWGGASEAVAPPVTTKGTGETPVPCAVWTRIGPVAAP